MSGKVLVVTAVHHELDKANAPPGVDVIYTGLGKVNAAYETALGILTFKPDLVVNFGTVGKINKDLHGLLEISHVVQRDMLTMPLEPRGQTPMSSDPVCFESGHGTAICGTGDSFVTFVDPWLVDNGIDVVDMELFAIAHVCYRQKLPWRAFKFITDDADDNAAEHWTTNIADGEALFWEVLKKLLSDRLR